MPPKPLLGEAAPFNSLSCSRGPNVAKYNGSRRETNNGYLENSVVPNLAVEEVIEANSFLELSWQAAMVSVNIDVNIEV